MGSSTITGLAIPASAWLRANDLAGSSRTAGLRPLRWRWIRLYARASISCSSPSRPGGQAGSGPFQDPLTPAEMTNKQAVVNTTAGTFVIELRPDLAPNHVGYFIKLARGRGLQRHDFHRVIKLGIIQGGDPLSKDPAKAKLYGTGGLGVLKAEIGGEKKTRGAVAAVLQPGKPDSARRAVLRLRDGSAGARRQVHRVRPRLRRHGGRAEDLRGAGRRRRPGDRPDRDSSRSTIRDTPPPEPEPFQHRDAPRQLRAVSRGARHRRAGPITLEFFPDKAPGHVRNFLRLAAAGVYDGTVVPPRREGLRGADRLAEQPRTADREAAEVRPQPAARVQRHAARQGHRVDGARRRSGERHDLVLHLHRRRQLARRQIHGLRPRRRRHQPSSRRSSRCR